MSQALASPAKVDSPIKRVAILFSGGPAPAANAVIASAAIAFSRNGVEVLGIRHGYSHLMAYDGQKPLVEGKHFIRLCHADLELVRSQQGIIIGTARANPGKSVHTYQDLKDPEKTAPLKTVYDALCSLNVDALVSIGGDDTLTTAAKFQLFQKHLPPELKRIAVVHLPKTIDNDYEGIDFTFGYFTAVDMLATQARNLLADARAAGAYFFVQVMGRKAGWLAYGAGIAGEASLIVSLEDIPPEWWTKEVTVNPKTGQPVIDPKTGQPQMRDVIDVKALAKRVADTIIARENEGKGYGVVIFAEGMGEYFPLEELRKCVSEEEFAELEPDPFGHFPVSQLKFTGRLARLVNEEVKARGGKKKKISALQFGYEVRCHRPTAFDIILGSQLGVGAYRALIERGLDGVMVSVSGQLQLLFPSFELLMQEGKLRAKPRLIRPEEDFHQLPRYLEVRVEG
ncbi:MAG: 6-phosphofructokinase [Thermogutta sp.]